MKADDEGMDRLGISRDSIIGARVSECGFDVHTRDDGLWAEGVDGFYDTRRSPYNEYLKAQGATSGDNPWANNANAGVDADGNIASGWLMKNAGLAANIAEEDSETPWLTSRAIDFIESEEAREPWLCHLSYIKPHWPYIVPAPYNDMYDERHIQPAIRHADERVDPHPVYEQFMLGTVGRSFQRDDVRETVIPAYMGLVKQCDDQMGRLLAYLEDERPHGRHDDRAHVRSRRLSRRPLARREGAVPRCLGAHSADRLRSARRGRRDARQRSRDALVESIDLAPTFLEAIGAPVPGNILEGRSLTPLLRGEPPENWRAFAISEYDYSPTPAADALGSEAARRTALHGRDGAVEIRPRGRRLPPDAVRPSSPIRTSSTISAAASEHAEIIEAMYDHLFAWARRQSQRTTVSDERIMAMRNGGSIRKGILFGIFDEDEIDPQLLAKYRGKAPKRVS